MTPQQERIKQAEAFEKDARVWSKAAKAYKSGLNSRANRYAKFCQRMARNNRHAHKRNAS